MPELRRSLPRDTVNFTTSWRCESCCGRFLAISQQVSFRIAFNHVDFIRELHKHKVPCYARGVYGYVQLEEVIISSVILSYPWEFNYAKLRNLSAYAAVLRQLGARLPHFFLDRKFIWYSYGSNSQKTISKLIPL